MADLKHLGRGDPNCIFCPGKADSREHVWPRWVLERFRVPASGVIGMVGDDSYQDRNQNALRLRCVCRTCNTGWMKELEDQVIPLASSLAQDLAIPIPWDQQTLVAVWAMKTTLVWEQFSASNRRLFYLDEHREGLRTSRNMPENTEVVLARYAGQPLLFCATRDMTDDPAVEGADPMFRAVSTEIVFGRLAIQVLSWRTLMVDRVARMPEVTSPLEECTVRIWPPTRMARWPPRLSVGSDVPFEILQKRWGISPLKPPRST
ncbi:MAG: hypothetical protein AB7O37_06485 [Vicinamibacteria bacterium]